MDEKRKKGSLGEALTAEANYKRRLTCYIGLSFLLTFVSVSLGVSQTRVVPGHGPWPTTVWSATSPEAVGMNNAALKRAEKIYPILFPSSYSLLIVRKGQIVSESYFHGQTADTPNHIFSVTKTVVATLLGIATQQGLIEGVNQKVADLLPEYPVHPTLTTLTVEDVLTHRSGLRHSNKFTDILKQEPISPPGTTFEYSNQAPNLLTAILDRTASQVLPQGVSDVPSFARTYLFDPLGIHINQWANGPHGIPDGGNGIYMTARDMARLGYLLLQNGQWEDQQLLPPGWVEAATKQRVEVDRQKGYGYLTWVRRSPDIVQTVQGEHTVQGYFAYGHLGQFIGVYPELDLLVVTTADATDSSRDTFFVPDLLHDFVRQFVFSSFIPCGNIQLTNYNLLILN